MKKLCEKCKKNNATKVGHIFFNYQSIDFKTFKLGFECDNCAKLDTIRQFKKYRKNLILEIKDGEIGINWRYYIKEQERGADMPLGIILNEIGIFSLTAKDCWEIISDHRILLNPQSFGCFYFTKKCNALDFAALKYGNTQYNWEIRHIDIVISKKTALKRK